jgi:hypothetical protein
MVVNGDKYPVLESLIKIGTPYVQLIPFKRESWKMKVESLEIKKNKETFFYSFKHVIDNYKKLYWFKKKWR